MARSAPELNVTNLCIDKAASTPLYMQVFNAIRESIISGLLRPGQRIPSGRQIAMDYKISRNVVNVAFEQLVLEGYIVSRTGSGSFVSECIPDEFTRGIDETSKIPLPKINLFDTTGDNELSEQDDKKTTNAIEIIPFENDVPGLDIFPFSTWHKLATKEYRDIASNIWKFNDSAGYFPLRESIAQYLRSSRGINCEAEQILIVNGIQQAFHLFCNYFVEPGDLTLMEDPGCMEARSAFYQAGANVQPVPIETDGLDISFLQTHYKNARALYVTPAHQYPMGGTLSLSKRFALLRWATENDTWILEDDYDGEFRYKGKPLAALKSLDEQGRVIYSGSFNKGIFPGLSLGYMVLPNHYLMEQFSNLKNIVDRQGAIMEQIITHKFLSKGYFARHLRSMRVAYLERQQVLIRAIKKELPDDIDICEQPAGIHLIAWLKKQRHDVEVSEKLRQHGIVTKPLSQFTLRFEQPPGLILGYTGFNKFRIRHHVQRMAQIIKK